LNNAKDIGQKKQKQIVKKEKKKELPNFKAFGNFSTPVIVVGLPKSGTTSITNFFRNLSYGALHWASQGNGFCENQPQLRSIVVENNIKWPSAPTRGGGHCLIATRVHYAIQTKQKPLHYILTSDATIVTQLDYCVPPYCIFPQIDAINILMDSYPNAYFIHSIRSIQSHTTSILNWNDFAKRLKSTNHLDRFPDQKLTNSLEKKIEIFVSNAQNIVRKAALARPGIKYLEINLMDNNSTTMLKSFLNLTHTDAEIPHMNRNNHISSRGSSAKLKV
jgi:hypothetical protein